MNGIFSGLLLSAVPYVVVMVVGVRSVAACDKHDAKAGASIVLCSSDGTDGEPVVVHSEDGGDVHVVRVTATVDEDGRSEGTPQLVRILRKVDAGAEDQGWLGVMIKSVGSEGTATVTLTNIVTGSPADEAGLLAGDVLVSVDGEALSGDLASAINMIKAHKAGDEVTIVVLRDGQEETVTATLGSRAESQAATIEMKFDTTVDGEVEDRIVTRGRMLTRDDDGAWVMTELGDLSKLNNLPTHIQMFVPQAGTRVMSFGGDDASRTVHIEIKGDDTLSINQEDGGDITVTRVDTDGNETVNVYADEDEMKADDEAAYEIFNRSGTHNLHHLQFFGDGADFDMEDFDFDFGGNEFVFSFDGKDFDASAFEWNEHLEEGLAEATASAEEALVRARVLIERIEDVDGMPAIEKLHQLRPLFEGGHGAHAFRFDRGKPRQSFEVRPDGTIEVKIRKGDTEVVQLFTNEADLADRKPDLFEKYRNVMDAE